MRSAAAALIVIAGNALAHPGHGAPEGHVHAWRIEHALLLLAILFFLFIVVRRKD